MESHGARTLADDHLFNFQVEEQGTHKSKGARHILQVLLTPGTMVVRGKEGAIDEIRFKDILRCEPHESTDGEPTALRLQVAEVPTTGGGSSRTPTWNSAAPTAWLEFLTVQTLILAGVCNVPADRLRRAAPNLSGLDNRVLRSGTLTRKSESFWGKTSQLYAVLTAHKLYLFVSPPRMFLHTGNNNDDAAAATPEQHVRHVCFLMGATVQRRGCEVVIKPVKAKQMTLLLDSELEARQWTKDISAAAAAAAAAEPTAAARTLALLHALSAYSSKGCTGELSLDDTPPTPYTSQSSAATAVVGEGLAATEVEADDAPEVEATVDEQDTTAPPPEHNNSHGEALAGDEAGEDVPASHPLVEKEAAAEEQQQRALEQQALGVLGVVSADSVSAGLMEDGAAEAAATVEAQRLPEDEDHEQQGEPEMPGAPVAASVEAAEAAAEAAQQLAAQPQDGDDADNADGDQPLTLSPAAAVLGSAVHSTEETEAELSPDAATEVMETTDQQQQPEDEEDQGELEMPQYWYEPGTPVATSTAAAIAAEVETAAEVEPDVVTEAKTEADVATEAEVEPDADVVTEVFYSAGGDESAAEDHLPPVEANDDCNNSDAGSEATVESHAVAVVPPSASTTPLMHRAAGAATATAGSMAMGMLAHATADGGEGGGAYISGGAADGGNGGGMLWSGMDVVLTPHFAACASASSSANNPNAVTTLHTVHARCSLTVTMEMTVTAGVAAAAGFVSPASSSASAGASRTASPQSVVEPSTTTGVAEVVSNHIQPTAALESAIPPSEAVTMTMTTPPRASSAAGRLTAPRTPPTPKPAQSGSNDVKHAAYVESVTCTPATLPLPPPQLTPSSGYAASDERGVKEAAEAEPPSPYAAAESHAELAGADVELQTEVPIQPPPPTATADSAVECAHAAPSAVSSSPFKIADRKHLLATSSEGTSFISPVGACKHKHAPSKPVWSPAGHTRRNH